MDGEWSLMVVYESMGRADPEVFGCFLEIPDFTMIAEIFLELAGKSLSKRVKKMKIVFRDLESVKRSWEKSGVFYTSGFEILL